MIRVKRRLIFNILETYYESVEKVTEAIRVGGFQKARVYSYVPLKLPAGFHLERKKPTSVIDVSSGMHTVWEHFRKNYRNEISKTKKDEKYTVVTSPTFHQLGYELYSNFESSAGRKIINKKDIEGVWFLGFVDGELLNGILVREVMPVMKIQSIFSKRLEGDMQQQKDIGFLSKRLVYEICQYAYDNKYSSIDLAYINDTDPTKAGITSFKRGFGGDDAVEYLYEKKLLGIL